MFELKKNWSKYASIAVAVLFVLVLNLFTKQMLPSVRLDFTEHDLYTLSEESKRILAKLNEPITLSYFVSRSHILELPGVNAFASRVEDYLQEYSRLSNGMITLKIIEPEAYSEEEDLAVGHGLRGIPVSNESVAYLGLVAENSVDDIGTIPIFLPEREEILEYDLTKLIYELDTTVEKVVGVISSLPIQGSGGFSPSLQPQMPPWTFYNQLNSVFDIRQMSPSIENLPDNLDVLVLIHPKNISEKLLFQIDQFALGGGSLLVFMDPYSEVLAELSAGMQQIPSLEFGSNLDQLTQSWGVTLDSGKILGDLPIAARVLEGDGSTGRTIDYPVWMNVQPDQLNADDVITSQLGNIILATAGVFKIDPNSELDLQPLIHSTLEAHLYDYDMVVNSNDIRNLLENYSIGGQEHVMAVRIRGRGVTNFPLGSPVAESTDGRETSEHTLVEEGDLNVILVADTDFMHDRFWVRSQQVLGTTVHFADASNGEFIHNSVENLSGDNNLIGVRSRGSYFRPFTRLQEIRQSAEQQYLEHERRLLNELSRIENLLLEYGSQESE